MANRIGGTLMRFLQRRLDIDAAEGLAAS